MVYNQFLNTLKYKKLFSLLIDPEEYTKEQLFELLELAECSEVDYILIGGSFIHSISKFEETVQFVKAHSNLPVIIFPGNYKHVSPSADGILLLNLISGRNPEYLIGQQVMASKAIKESGLEVIPTAYILIENGKTTSVEYISNTKPIPADKYDIIISTALAGEQMGNKLIYLEAGSGARNPVDTKTIRMVKENITIPLIVGGGIRDKQMAERAYRAGADMVVMGNHFQQKPNTLKNFAIKK